jgi:hypothetical protein
VTRVLVGTAAGLKEIDPNGGSTRDDRTGPSITALATVDDEIWAILDGRTLVRRSDDGSWVDVAAVDGPEATSLLHHQSETFVGTDEAHLRRLAGDRLEPVDGFERVAGRADWYTPWGGPPAVRSLSAGPSGAIHANVHVGGIPRSVDGGVTWEPTIDIDADVHQVLAHPDRDGVVLAAAAVGLAVSADGGGSWLYETEGLHATYARAVAVSQGAVFLTASRGPWGPLGAVYRASLDDPKGIRFERCRDGLPEWFDQNIDSGCLAASGDLVAFGTADGALFMSTDRGLTWARTATDLPQIRVVLIS